jgi:hypothetical protein
MYDGGEGESSLSHPYQLEKAITISYTMCYLVLSSLLEKYVNTYRTMEKINCSYFQRDPPLAKKMQHFFVLSHPHKQKIQHGSRRLTSSYCACH